ncbi:MAG: adenosine kinase [Pseudomonadota bacterium]|nr:adenosine kinase [Pseudomonadota bacterium]
MERKYHVYGVGNALVDMEFEVEDAFLEAMHIGKGLMTLVDQNRQIELLAHLGHGNARWSCGGSAANTIIAASRFGGRAFYSCKVASDELGDFYVDDLVSAGVDSNLHAERTEGDTGRCLVMITPDAERTMNTFLGITETLSGDELNREAVRNSGFLYIEGYLVSSPTGRAAAIEARRIAEAAGVQVALTFSDPAMVKYFREGLSEMLGAGIDLLFCNEAEALAWADTDDLNLAVEALRAVSRTFAITRGAKGALLFDGTEFIEIAPHEVHAVDTNGAGDMFAGAFLYGITQGHSWEDAGRIASAASARVVSNFGPRLEGDAHTEILDTVMED